MGPAWVRMMLSFLKMEYLAQPWLTCTVCMHLYQLSATRNQDLRY
jgi:hypothetical protein